MIIIDIQVYVCIIVKLLYLKVFVWLWFMMCIRTIANDKLLSLVSRQFRAQADFIYQSTGQCKIAELWASYCGKYFC